MRNLNVVIMNGRIGKEFVLKKTQNGKSVVSFSIAVQYDKEVMWVNVVAWDKTADTIDRYCSKGSFIGVEGRLIRREWEDKEGNKRSTYEVLAHSIQLLDPKKSEDNGKSSHDDMKRNGFQNDDIPF